MIKKRLMTFVFIVLILFMMPFFLIQATPPSAEPGITFVLSSNACSNETFDGGNFDLLVKREDVEEKITETINPLYQTLYGHIENIIYLQEDDSIWLSYLAYVEDANMSHENKCFFSFAQQENEYFMFNEVKLIYFSDTGETIYVSEAIEIIHPKTHEVRYGEIIFYADEPYRIDNNYSITGGYRFILALLLGIKMVKWIFYPVVITAGLIILYALIRVVIIQLRRRK